MVATLLTILWMSSALLIAISLMTLIFLMIRKAIHNRKTLKAKRLYTLTRETLIISVLRPDDICTNYLALFRRSERDFMQIAECILDQFEGDIHQQMKAIINHPLIKEDILDLAKNGKAELKMEALYLMGHMDQADTRIQLKNTLYSDDSEDVLIAAANSLAHDDDIDDDLILTRLNQLNSLSPIMASEVLITLAHREKPYLLTSLLIDNEIKWHLKHAALLALLSVPQAIREDMLITLFETTQEEEIRREILRVGLLLKKPQAFFSCIDEALASNSAILMVNAILWIAHHHAHHYMKQLQEMLIHTSWIIRLEAARCLFSLGEKGEEILQQHSQDEVAGVYRSYVATRVLAEQERICLTHV